MKQLIKIEKNKDTYHRKVALFEANIFTLQCTPIDILSYWGF